MEIQELKDLWARSERRLTASMRLNVLLLEQANLRKTDGSLQRLSRGIVAELILNFLGLVLIGSFAADNVREPRFLVPAVLLGAYAVGLLIAGVCQIVAIAGVDFDEPVVAIQKRLEALRLLRVRTTLGVLLFAPLMWVPLLIVALRGLFGVDAYAAGVAWLAANVAFGLAIIPVAIFIARRYGDRLRRTGLMRGLTDAIAGRSLAAALESLDAIQRFERDD
ncbi:MAG: hypothetical protein JO190_11615 [Candidatus Eremiobacteraeota bacterium]|nr:hypothetical protein [Candidatus Eremiobacteraeota bacterium]MBV8498484.1 hypothetical protein [Candidatus Eremiobacteraeota bacterium]